MKYIIEIEDKPVGGLYKAKEFNTLVFDYNGLQRLEPLKESGSVYEALRTAYTFDNTASRLQPSVKVFVLNHSEEEFLAAVAGMQTNAEKFRQVFGHDLGDYESPNYWNEPYRGKA